MAIDTTEKKLSLLDFEDVGGSHIPFPDGSLDQGDKQHGLWSYSGIAFNPPVVVVGDAAASDFRRSDFAQADIRQSDVRSSDWGVSFRRVVEFIGGAHGSPRLVPQEAR